MCLTCVRVYNVRACCLGSMRARIRVWLLMHVNDRACMHVRTCACATPPQDLLNGFLLGGAGAAHGG